MGRILNGANGGFSGKAGSVIGSSWKSIHYIKGLHKKRTKPATEDQLSVQAQFKLLMDFLSPINSFLKIGFGKKRADRSTPMNYAVSLNKPKVILGSYPDFSLDYSRVQLADGNYAGGGTVAVAYADAELTVEWSRVGSPVMESKDDDSVYILGYHPVRNEFVSPPTLPQRVDGAVTFELPQHLLDDVLHVWIFFADRTKNRISKSVYLGEVALD